MFRRMHDREGGSPLGDQHGFYAVGLGLSLAALALVAMGFVFFSFMKLTMQQRAELELHQEVDDAMRMMTADAAEAASFRLHETGGSMRVSFQKARADAGGETGMTYGTKREGARVKFCRARDRMLQPLTGESTISDVTVEAFRAEELRPGCLHIELAARSQRTGRQYRQTAEFVLGAER